MANRKRSLQQEVKQEQTLIEPVQEQIQEPVLVEYVDTITATIQAVDSTEQPVTIQGKKIQPSEHRSKKQGVALRYIATGQTASSSIDERVAKQMVRDFPTKVEIVHEN